jgi:hypothetical protein
LEQRGDEDREDEDGEVSESQRKFQAECEEERLEIERTHAEEANALEQIAQERRRMEDVYEQEQRARNEREYTLEQDEHCSRGTEKERRLQLKCKGFGTALLVACDTKSADASRNRQFFQLATVNAGAPAFHTPVHALNMCLWSEEIDEERLIAWLNRAQQGSHEQSLISLLARPLLTMLKSWRTWDYACQVLATALRKVGGQSADEDSEDDEEQGDEESDSEDCDDTGLGKYEVGHLVSVRPCQIEQLQRACIHAYMQYTHC